MTQSEYVPNNTSQSLAQSQITPQTANNQISTQEESKEDEAAMLNALSLAAIEEEASKLSPLLSISNISKTFKVAFITKGEVLIYLALSKEKSETVTSLKK